MASPMTAFLLAADAWTKVGTGKTVLVQRTCNATIKVRTVAVGDPPPAATDPGIALYQAVA